ncbi:MAG: SET domain-containing protein-lysine N-methyltransferase [Simkaniaceae bacterium]|nr:SET domain-containing protein-lysine N-methyltransferase [Simkaniaceae bacterium]
MFFRKKEEWGMPHEKREIFLETGSSEPTISLFYQDEYKNIAPIGSEGFKKRFHVKYSDRLQFTNEKVLRSSYLRSQKRLKKIKIAQMNKWMLSLYQEDYHKGVQPQLLLKWIDPFLGHGLFANQEIPGLTYIGEYAGLVRKRKKALDRANDYVFGYVAGPHETPFVIDARKQGNHTRFINHSDEPNLLSRWVIIDGVSHIIFFTKRNITKGEQLSYDYGPIYWNKRAHPVVC